MLESIVPGVCERDQMMRALERQDSPDDVVFDRVTRLLARLLKVPIAMISLFDGQRLYFKSRVGLEMSELPVDNFLCSHAILQPSALVICDTTADPRFACSVYVTGPPHIRFYAGVPLRTSAGVTLGTLCVMDDQPRQLHIDQLDTLTDLADVVSREIQMREKILRAQAQVHQHDAALTANEETYRTMFQLASVGIALISRDGKWISFNDALCQIVGYDRQELKLLTFQDITHAQDLEADLQQLDQLAAGNIAHYQMEKRYLHKDGHPVWINLSVAKKTAADGALEYYIAIIQDIQARKELEQEARHDALTGLCNRRALDEFLPAAQARADRSTLKLAVMFIDLDGFKTVNDTYGHDAGDDLLREVANRLKNAIRLTDTLVRYAGDEFIVLLEGLHDDEQAHEVAVKLLHAIAEPIVIDAGSVHISASIGIALYEANNGCRPDELISQADAWMYKAKHAGKGRILPLRVS